MLETKRIMTILAHPDDETLGCGGTLHRFNNQDIMCLVPVRRIEAEFKNALEALGVEGFIFGKFEDNKMDKYPLADICKWVEMGIRSFKPDVIITHHHNCTNQDHRILYQASCIATRNSGIQLLSCEIPSSTGYLRPTGFEPNIYIRLSLDDIEAKIDAVDEYKSQRKNSRSPEVIAALATVRGAESGYDYAEGFMLVRGYE